MGIGGAVAKRLWLVLVLTTAVGAQTRSNGVFLTTPFEWGGGWDTGFLAGGQALSDEVNIVAGPTMEWTRSTHSSNLFITYLPEFEIFKTYSNLDAWNQDAGLRFTERLSAHTSLEFGDSFVATKDSNRELQNSLVLLPYGTFIQNTFFGDLKYRINHANRLTFRLDNAVTHAALPADLEGRLDEVGTAGTVTWDHDFDSRQTISVNYSFLHVDPLRPETGGSPTNTNLAVLAYAYQINPTLLLRLSAGGVRGSDSAFNGSAILEKQWGGLWLAGGYQRYIAFFGSLAPTGDPAAGPAEFASGVTPNSVYQVLSLRASGPVSRRVRLQGVIQRALNGVDRDGVSLRGLIGQLRLTYKLNDRVSIFAQGDHYGQTESLLTNVPLNRNRYFVGVDVALGRPPETDAMQKRRSAPEGNEGVHKPAEAGGGNF